MPEKRSHTPGTNREPGVGIGLSLSRDLVQRIGGAMNVESVEGKGSRFSFTIPLSAIEKAAGAPSGGRHEESANSMQS